MIAGNEMSGVRPRWSRAETICLAAFLLGAASICICSISRQVPWLPHYDDANYLVSAKALATGQGYRVISFPDAPPQTLFPPFYPFVLSTIWRVKPEFPANLKPMLLLSTAAALGFLLLIYGYLTERGHAEPRFALAIVLFTALNPLTLFYATSVMAETLYAALTIAGLWLIESSDKPLAGPAGNGRWWWHGVATGLVLGIAFLTRIVGVALIGAAVLHLARKRHWKRLAIISVIGFAFVMAWFVWFYTSSIHVPLARITPVPSRIGFMIERPGQAALDFLKIVTQNVFTLVLCLGATLVAFFIHVGADVRSTSTNLVLAAMVFALALLLLGFIRSLKGGLGLVHCFALLYLVVITIPPVPPQQRYLLPLVPLLLLWSGSELKRMAELFVRELRLRRSLTHGMIAGVLCACMVVWGAYVGYRYVHWTKILIVDVPASYQAQWLEQSKVLEWITENTDPQDILVCELDLLYYLFTGRRGAPIHGTAHVENAPYKWLPQWKPENTLEIVKKSHARYLIVGPTSLFAEYGRRVTEGAPAAFSVVYASPASDVLIYRINQERL